MGCRTATPALALVATSPVSDGKMAPPACARTKMEPGKWVARRSPRVSPPCQSCLLRITGLLLGFRLCHWGEG